MKVVNVEILNEFGHKHADCAAPLLAWLAEARAANWTSPADLKQRYPSASLLPGDRVIFNIKGNSYRLDTKINFTARLVFVKRVGTHAEYSKW
jgi:mRNA interferase HigB